MTSHATGLAAMMTCLALGLCLAVLAGCRSELIHVERRVSENVVTIPAFMSGADVSGLPRLERDGAVYRSVSGESGDAIELLMSAGVDWFRLRLFVDPDGQGLVVNDLAYTASLGRRIKAADGSYLLDLHYSDTWADPGKQSVPQRWRGMDTASLTQEVERYTREVVEYLDREGCSPSIVQIGNEISAGMLWPHGQLYRPGDDVEAAFDRLAALLKAGARGVRSAQSRRPTPAVMLHLDRGDRWEQSQWFFDRVLGRGVTFDMIGFSYYPRFHGSLTGVRENLKRTAERYGKPVVLVEVGFAYTGGEWEPQRESLEFAVTPEGQAQFASSVVDAVRDVPDGLGVGVFWWHAAATPTPGDLAWEGGRLGLFDAKGRLLPAAHTLGGK